MITTNIQKYPKKLEILNVVDVTGDPELQNPKKQKNQGMLMPLVTLLGLLGNTLAILVLHSPGVDMKVLYHNYQNLNLILNLKFLMNLYLILISSLARSRY